MIARTSGQALHARLVRCLFLGSIAMVVRIQTMTLTQTAKSVSKDYKTGLEPIVNLVSIYIHLQLIFPCSSRTSLEIDLKLYARTCLNSY